MKHIVKALDRQHLLGTIFIAIAIAMVVQGLWISHKQDEEAKCQADYNQKTSAVQKQRAEWSDEDRAALNTMIFKVIDTKSSAPEREDAVQLWAVTARKNDANRKANPAAGTHLLRLSAVSHSNFWTYVDRLLGWTTPSRSSRRSS